MDMYELYRTALGIVEPWKIENVKFDPKGLTTGEVVVTVAFDKEAEIERDEHIHGYVDREWRHLDTCQYQTIVRCKVPRLKYQDGSTKEIQVPWAEKFSRVTTLMEAHCVFVLQTSKNTTAAGQHLKMSRGSLDRIMKRAVDRGLERRPEEAIPYIGMDEKAIMVA